MVLKYTSLWGGQGGSGVATGYSQGSDHSNLLNIIIMVIRLCCCGKRRNLVIRAYDD